MKRRQHPPRLPSKEDIRKKAEKGFFDHNPLLATPHEVLCKECGYKNRVVILEYIKSGRFELGKTGVIEVTFAASTTTGLGRALERATPLIIRIKCKRCGTTASHSPISLEYLLFTAKKSEISGIYI